MNDWICPGEIPCLASGSRVALFGAGKGTIEYLALTREQAEDIMIVAIADNDSSMWGKSLHGIPIIAPDDLRKHSPDAILITTVSGRDAVGKQLEGLGYPLGEVSHPIGVFPAASVGKLRLIYDAMIQLGGFKSGQQVLHVGPGGFLGVECCLKALGLQPVSLDAYGFSMVYPDITEHKNRYVAQRAPFLTFAAEIGRDTATTAARWDSLFFEHQNRTFIDSAAVPCLFPHRFSSLPFDNACFDLVISLEVLEHVHRPAAALAETWRVLRPGGAMVCQITTQDHRSFSQVEGYTPLSYLQHSEKEWKRLNQNKFYQNRLVPGMWKRLFQDTGFILATWHVTGRYEPSEVERDSFHEAFRTLPLEMLSEMNCVVAAVKPAASA